ncbi:TENX protein, partial [Catharus fuscescens]|nr:TENX protein [Catharus fuscescens]
SLDGSTHLYPLSITAAEKPEELPLHTEEPQHEKPQTEAATSEAAPPQAILEGLRVSSVTPDSMQLQWSVLKGSFDSFMLQYRDAHGQPQALPIDGTSRSVMVSGLSPFHRYRFHLYGLRGGKRIARVSTDTVTGEAETSEEPVPSEEPEQKKPKIDSPVSEALPARAMLGELKISSVTPKSVQLQWSVPKGSFDSFTLQYRDAQGQPQALAINGESRLVTVPGLSPSRRYRFHLYGLRGRKKTDHVSTEVMTADPEDLPSLLMDPTNEVSTTEAPTNEDHKLEHPQTEAPSAQAMLRELKVSSITPDSVGLQWTIPKDSFDSFMLQYRDAQGQPQALPIDGGSQSVIVP